MTTESLVFFDEFRKLVDGCVCFYKDRSMPRKRKNRNLGREVFTCRNGEDLKCPLTKVKDPIFQELLTGKEYIVDMLNDLEGSPLVTIPRERIETKAGITTRGRIVLDEEIERICLNRSILSVLFMSRLD